MSVIYIPTSIVLSTNSLDQCVHSLTFYVSNDTAALFQYF